MASERNVQFAAPTWLRDLGFSSWLLVGFVLVIIGLVWLLGETSTIVMPVVLATVLGAVAGPAVGWLERHRVPRIGGAILVLLGLVAVGVLVFCLVFGGISAQSGDISAKMTRRSTRSRAGSATWVSITHRAPRRACRTPRPGSARPC